MVFMSEMDLSYLEEISGGDAEFIQDMIETFLEETPKDLNEMKVKCHDKNWVEVGKLAHKLKSSIKMFGFESLKNAAVQLEKDGKDLSAVDSIPGKLDSFYALADLAMVELRAKI